MSRISRPPRTLHLCADDYGLRPGVSRCIFELAARGRLSALSCLSNAEHWATAAPALRDLPSSVEVGLHFNLSEGRPASAALRAVWPQLPPLPRLIAAAHLRRLPLAAIGEEWSAQWQAFVDAQGRPPDFVDGHQHVHHLPGVRELVLAAAARTGVAVRNTGRVLGPGWALKRWLIAHTGGTQLLAALQAQGLRHNAVLLGAYDFVASDYRALMRAWLAQVPAEGALLFCHPGHADAGFADAIGAARKREAAYLASAEFAEDLAAAGVTLAPAWLRSSSGG
jgi:predicted glycoside hydrolase/deacetylase ChbG (UPF0249 family)